ncbi:MAG: hypothetical protein RR146_03145 [Lachnospiraceae bacterium]
MRNQIIFIYQNYFEERDFQRFGMEIFKRKKIDVQIWSTIYLSATRKKIAPVQELCKRTEVFYPKSKSELENKIGKNANKQFLLLIPYSKDNWIRKKIIKEKCVYYELHINPPLLYSERVLSKNLIEKVRYVCNFEKTNLTKFSVMHVFKEILLQYIYMLIDTDGKFLAQSMLHPPKYYFCSTRTNKNHIPILLQQNSRFRYIHSLNYDEYLKANSQPPEKNRKKYILYIDAGDFTIHPDIVLLGGQDHTQKTKQSVKEKLLILFEQLENQFNCEIIISGHPRANYEGNEFGNRKFSLFHTVELVKHAEFVIMSYSTALDYVVLYNKRLLFWWSDLINTKYERYACTDYLGIEPYMIDKPTLNPTKYIRKISKDIRKKYIMDYIKGRDSQDIDFFEQVADIMIKENRGCQ